jgi:hypothetical protein
MTFKGRVEKWPCLFFKISRPSSSGINYKALEKLVLRKRE